MTKSTSILELYLKFLDGAKMSKAEISRYFDNKSDRTIQRYISTLNGFLQEYEATSHLKIEYNYKINAFYMVNKGDNKLNASQVLAVLKILIATRGLGEEEVSTIIHNLTEKLSTEDKRIIEKAIQSELIHYHPMNHEAPIFQQIWDINLLIQKNKTICFEYANALNQVRQHTVKPLYITFSELYFYLVAVDYKKRYTIYRLDRIQEYHVTTSAIELPNSPYYKEGELKKRIYFMYAGEWKRVRFEFNQGIIESVIDRFPTAKLIKSDYTNNRFTVEIEVMGDDGILMWLFSQGSKVKVLEPKSLKEKYVKELQKMLVQNAK